MVVTRRLASVCVFCGSSDDVAREYLEAARQIGDAIARRGTTLVYGGGGTGLMGALANGALESGGRVIGVLTEQFDTPVLRHPNLSERRVVPTMHERKALMSDLSEGFVALPGGFGTFEELFEILCWAQLGIHARPIGLLNTRSYFGPLLAMIEHARAEGFIYNEHNGLYFSDPDPDALLDRMGEYQAPAGLDRWLSRDGGEG
ncbi:MAG TPA: TIGR00730 family Rossman fold protein [Anaerolineales bacterium]|nr:TIGR00730 family Rossman fold protein [Anaerolineales bacterium]